MHEAGEILGPVDYVVVEFGARSRRPGPGVVRELAVLAATELIRILDVILLTRHEDGLVDACEVDDLADCGLRDALPPEIGDLLSVDDLRRLAETLTPDTTGIVVVYENTWAAPLTAEVHASGAQLVASGRVPSGNVALALAGPGAGTELTVRATRFAHRDVLPTSSVRDVVARPVAGVPDARSPRGAGVTPVEATDGEGEAQ